MSGSRMILLGAIVVAVAGVAMAVASSSSGDASSADLAKKIDALSKKIDSLENTLAKRMTALEQQVAKGGGGGGPSPQLETEAQAALRQINQLVGDGEYDKAKTQMASFMKKYGATNTARSAQRMNQELAVIGKEAPAKWGIEKWFQGESDIDLTSNDTTLLVFWEVWCPHCKREVPKMQEIYNTYKDKGLQVVGLTKITRSATDESVQSFVTDNSVGYPVAKEDGSLSSYFGVSGIPAAAVLKDGKVIWRGHPARLSEQLLGSWL